MNFTEEQRYLIDLLKNDLDSRGTPSEFFLTKLCKSFHMDYFFGFCGIGGTRFVIRHPQKEGKVLKIAFTEEGIQGNKEEYEAYHAAPEEVKDFLGIPGELLEDGLMLEMNFYDPIDETFFYEQKQGELLDILKKIRFVHYYDPPYYHSFGLDMSGDLILIDYGETEKFELVSSEETGEEETFPEY